MGYELRGGKLAPRLIQDIKSYNPQKLNQGPFDALSEIPYHEAFEDDADPPLPDISCQHHWAQKPNQTVLAGDEAKTQPRSVLRSFCLKCRCHLQVTVAYDQDGLPLHPCPTIDRPLHHFVLENRGNAASDDSDATKSPSWSTRSFRCSSSSCGLHLSIKYAPPRLKHDWTLLLTDRHIIRARAEKAIASDPEKFQGHAPPTPGNVLEKLCTLINKALEQADTRPISQDSKGILLNLGEACSEILQYLGFHLKGSFWHFPEIKTSTSETYDDAERMLLDDVRSEVWALMLARPDDERRALKFSYSPISGLTNLQQAMSCQTYKKKVDVRKVDMSALEHPSYAGLGSIADLHDELIWFAYTMQIFVDNQNSPYYLECLQTIAEGRSSEELSTKVAIQASEGRVSLKDVRNAYYRLGIHYRDPSLLDENIIGTFRARLQDAPRQEAELRQYLRIIATHRNSAKLQSAVTNTVNDYEQAINFLDATTDTPDPFIVSCYAVKIDAKPSDESMARRAVALIANHRKSKALRQWLDTGVLGDVEMDISQAYARLNVTDRTVDDDMIVTIYEIGAEEQPSQIAELKQALATIGKDRKSQTLITYAGVDQADDDHALAEWPVALNNIGNTCYLNSLLQFYFSIRPFRDLVLNIEGLQSSIEDGQSLTKKVGGRKVSRLEIRRAQHTVQELKRLFENMITSSSRSVRPDTELARVTLLTPKAESARRQSIRQSMNSEERPVILSSNGHDHQVNDSQAAEGDKPETLAIHPPLLNVTPHVPDPKGILAQPSNTSSETLIEDDAGSMAIDGGRDTLQSSNSQETSFHIVSMPENLEREMKLQREGESSADTIASNAEPASTEAPNQPPPIPPRPKVDSKPEEAVKEAEFAAQQQDVTEIAYNILNQLQCAIRPMSFDSDGEQIDQIKQLFYGKQKTYITNQSGQVRTKEEYISDIKVNAHGGPIDIYAALDGAFDVEEVTVAGGIEPKYSTISQLPPVLQVHIQRGQYDSANKKQFKSIAHIQLRETIYLDRYVDTTNQDIISQREQSWGWKRELVQLKLRREKLMNTEAGMNVPDAINCACGYLRQLEGIEEPPKVHVPESLIAELEKAATEAQAEIKEIENAITTLESQIASQFKAFDSRPYRLAAVFMHRGSTNAGHYWIYIFDFERNVWRSYNDERVMLVEDATEIFDPPHGERPATPYFLVYVQDDMKRALVDPVCRRVEVATEPVNDTPMEDEYEQIELDDHNPTTMNGWEDTSMTGGGW